MDTPTRFNPADVIVEDIEPGTPEWEESEYALGYKKRPARMPEWRRRSLEGRNRFDAVNDQTDRVAGR